MYMLHNGKREVLASLIFSNLLTFGLVLQGSQILACCVSNYYHDISLDSVLLSTGIYLYLLLIFYH